MGAGQFGRGGGGGAPEGGGGGGGGGGSVHRLGATAGRTRLPRPPVVSLTPNGGQDIGGKRLKVCDRNKTTLLFRIKDTL